LDVRTLIRKKGRKAEREAREGKGRKGKREKEREIPNLGKYTEPTARVQQQKETLFIHLSMVPNPNPSV